MKTSHAVFIIAGLAVVGLVSFSSRTSRRDAINRVSDAAQKLNGDVDDTPDIVQEQRKRERERQNSKWTLENQRKHPLEYCRAMVEQLDKDAADLDVALHKYQTAQAAVSREITANEGDAKKYSEFLDKAKAAYRAAADAGKWPVSFNGRELTQDEFKDKIIDADKRLKSARVKIPELRTRLGTLEKREAKATKNQEEIAALREKFQSMIRDIELNRIGSETGKLDDSLGALRDSLSALGQSSAVGNDDEEFFSTSPEEEKEAEFNVIMGN